ncbi:MAG TPA: lipopolysaccharide heptosyltransferase II [Bacteroidota bacterium]|nr:lipopolysaccharide heptosyltransferase II [Bacteroidota bacterium]
MRHPNKILIIRFSSIGDIVLATTLLRVARIKYPHAQIDFLTKREYSSLIRYNPNINNAYEFDSAGGVSSLRKMKRKLLAEQYDLVIDIHNSLRSRYVRKGIARKIVTIKKHVLARMMLVKFKWNMYHHIVSVADRYIETLKEYGVHNDGKGLEIYIPDQVRSGAADAVAALRLNGDEKVFGFCPAAKHATKRWPQDRFVELGIALAQRWKAKIFLFGGPEDINDCGAIANAINSATGKTSAENLCGKCSLLETAAMMKYCDVVVSNDTGLMHIAAAMKRKLVALFGSTVKEFGFFPVGTKSIVLERTDLPCRPCSHIGRASCPQKHFKCMNDISVGAVFDACSNMLAGQ